MKMTKKEAEAFALDADSWVVVEEGRFTRCSLLTFKDRAWMKIERKYTSFAYTFKSKVVEEKKVGFGAGVIYMFDPEAMATSYTVSKTQLIESIWELSKEEEQNEKKNNI